MAKILVVEDESDLNKIICRSLRDRGYDVISAANGLEALEKMEMCRFDMILTDIMMPKMDGFALADSIRLTDKDIPIIFMTAKDDKPSKMFAYSIGVDDYILKPFDIDILIMKIGVILRRAKIEAQKELVVGNLTINAEERSATINGEEINLFDFISHNLTIIVKNKH